MRLLSTLLLLLSLNVSPYMVEAQDDGVEKVRKSLVTIEGRNIDLFTKLADKSTLKDKSVVRYLEEYQISPSAIDQLLARPQEDFSFLLSFKGQEYKLSLQPKYLKTEQYQLAMSKEQRRDDLTTYFYRGDLEGDDGWATMAVIGREVRILIAAEDKNIEIIKAGDRYHAHENHDRVKPLHYHCDVDDMPAKEIKSNGSSQNRASADCLELSLTCDFASFQANGNSVSQTEAWALSLINNVAAIYDQIGVPLVVSEVEVFTSSDPYIPFNNKSIVRNEFVTQSQGNYEGRVAYLLSTRDLDGGIAYGIGGFCADETAFPGPFAVATSLSSTIVPFPSYSFNTQVIAHELGHVMGSRHTHACAWNGNDTQIDDCGNVWATANNFTPEGLQCYDDQSPMLPSSGTVMSLCDLVGGVGINLADGFGQQPGDLIAENYSDAICLTGGECASIPPSNDFCNSAIPLTAKTFCVKERFDNIMSTASGLAGGCGFSPSTVDVWFTSTSTSPSMTVQITEISNSFERPIIEVYAGSCSNLIGVGCIANSSGIVTTLNLNSLGEGQDIFIRVGEVSNNIGSFEICITDIGAPCSPDQSSLIALYTNTGGSSWNNNGGWSTNINSNNCDICQWYGITCDLEGNVIELDLSFNNLVGTIPSSFEGISTLRKIDFFSNTLSGNIPDVFSNMDELEYLDLSANDFTGNVPPTIFDKQNLSTLYLENNNLSGPLPSELGLLTSIDILWMKNNQLSGCWPSSYSNLCDISSTSFTGNVGLPGEGDFPAYCASGIGSDVDLDGFCSGPDPDQDCDDNFANIYPGAPEICDGRDNNCDGMTDENLVTTTTWDGSANKRWIIGANWSANAEPRACEDVLIEGSGDVRVFPSSSGFARSLTVIGSATLTIDGQLTISGSDDYGFQLGSNATCINNGTLVIDYVSLSGMEIYGNFDNNGTIIVNTIGVSPNILIALQGELDNIGGNIQLL